MKFLEIATFQTESVPNCRGVRGRLKLAPTGVNSDGNEARGPETNGWRAKLRSRHLTATYAINGAADGPARGTPSARAAALGFGALLMGLFLILQAGQAMAGTAPDSFAELAKRLSPAVVT